ncbi:MAG: stage V sporulation protein AD [Erysipelotrichales bacterium]|nr:stage V sporulation protein AD [Erysipelotrichales bacterium]
MNTLLFHDVYVLNYATSVTNDEANGPLGSQFDVYYQDLYCTKESYEKAEQELMRSSIHQALAKAGIKISDIGFVVGGDLMNQLMTTNYVFRDLNTPSVGVYGACSNSALSIAIASLLSTYTQQMTIATTASHYASAEKQFRYPNEYGIQKRNTTTTTVSGAGAVILTNKKQNIHVKAATIGKIIDGEQRDVNDMGTPMSLAAYDTITTHFKNTKTNFEDYDLVVTGDLSGIGHAILKDMLRSTGHDTEVLQDCGLIISRNMKNMFQGGSGCACSMLVLLSDIFRKIESQELDNVLFVATGALLSPIAVQQKDTIPCVAHAIWFERSR